MAQTIVSLPLDYFPDPNKGRPIFNGQIFVGEPDTDPQILANRKDIVARQEGGTEIPISPAEQPVRTSAGGVPEYNGATVQILVEGNYSIKVLDKGGSQEYFWPNVFNGTPLVIGDDHNLLGGRDDLGAHDTIYNRQFDTLSDAVNTPFDISSAGETSIELKERTLGNGGGGVWDIVLSSGVIPNGFDIVQSVSVPVLSIVLRFIEPLPLEQIGFISGNQTTIDDTINFAELNSIDVWLSEDVTIAATSLTILVYGFNVTLGNGKLYVPFPKNVYSSTQGARNSINYETGDSVTVKGKSFPMGGFRMHGQYYKDIAPVFNTPSFLNSVDIPSNLPFGINAEPGWYAIFANANDGELSPSFVAMPFLRVGSVSVSTITLNSTQENVTTVIPQNYSWANNTLINVEALVINEQISGRDNSFSGRETFVTANTSGTITLDAIGSIGFGDWILLAPDNKDHYRYCGSFLYEDAGGGMEEVRNIADTSTMVKAKMVDNLSAPTGSQVSTLRIPFGGMISPLAGAVIAKETSSFSTVSTGNYASTYDSDSSNHPVTTTYGEKVTTATATMIEDGLIIPFSFSQDSFYLNFGPLAAIRSGGKLEIQGWIEV
jgi:hypothetical protein